MAPRKSTRSRISQEEPEIGQSSNSEEIPQFNTIVFASWEQYEHFHRLHTKQFKPTKFLCTRTLHRMGIHDALQNLCTSTGTSAFFAMCEHSYPDLTLEFLSSFSYDKDNFIVKFRLLNVDYDMPLPQFGDYFDLGWNEGALNRVPNDFNSSTMWDRIARGAKYDSSKLRIHDVSHPVIRMWLRLLTGTLFARHEPGNTGLTDLAVLNSFLNVERKPRYKLYLAHFFAHHLHNQVHQNRRSVNVGGLVTYLAKKLNVLDDSDYEASYERGTNLLFTEYLNQYIRADRGEYFWLLRKGEIPLPIPRLPPLRALPEARKAHEPVYYTVEPRVSSSSSSSSSEDEATHSHEPVQSQEREHSVAHPTRSHTHSYHDSPAHNIPLHESPEHTQVLGSHSVAQTLPLGSGSHSVAPTIPLYDDYGATFPPYTHAPAPPMGGDGLPPLPSAREQYLHQNLTMYGLHASMVHQGFIPRTGPHPPYYTDPYAIDGGYPGTLFETAGVDRSDYEAIYGHSWVDRRNTGGEATSVRGGTNVVGDSQGGSRRSQRTRNRRGNGNE